MGNTDSMPVVSQVKSLVQVICNDADGALRTQENFVRGCPVVSQITSAVQAIEGNTEEAEKTQMYFVQNMSNMADAIPVVGHVKGGIHYACGDKEGGDNAMKASSRTVGVIGGGIGGFVVGGPVGSVVGGIAGGAAADGIITGATSLAEGEYRPYGHVQSATNAITGNMDAGGAFDWAMTPVFDGIAGKGYASVYKSIRGKIASQAAHSSYKAAIRAAIDEGKITLAEGETVSGLAKQIRSVAIELKNRMDAANFAERNVCASAVIDIEGNSHVGYSFRLREAANIDAFGGDVPSVIQLLDKRFKGGKPNVRGVNPDGTGVPQCAEMHGTHLQHQANGLNSNPIKTITVVYDGQGIQAVSRCGNCTKLGKYIDMGQVPTDALHGLSIPLENASIHCSLELLAGLCTCDEDHKEK